MFSVCNSIAFLIGSAPYDAMFTARWLGNKKALATLNCHKCSLNNCKHCSKPPYTNDYNCKYFSSTAFIR